MIGKDFWEDLDIDAYEVDTQLEGIAKVLVDQWGKSLTEADLLKLNAYSSAAEVTTETIIAKHALTYYNTQGYTPDFIHQHKTSTNAPWWKFWKRK